MVIRKGRKRIAHIGKRIRIRLRDLTTDENNKKIVTKWTDKITLVCGILL